MALTPPTPPPTTSLGGVPLGPLALGCVTFGREIDQVASFALMDHARARGVTLFDTASAYANGASERVVGAWLEARAPREGLPLVATKLLPPYEPARIREMVAGSRSRLGLETVDLLYLHSWDATAETDGALRTLHELVGEGTVRALGVINFDAVQLARGLERQAALGLAPFRVVQNNHNFAVRAVTPALRMLCATHGIAIVTYSPLGRVS